ALSEFPDIDVEIYEAASQLAEIGAGIGIFPRPWRVIQVLGLEEEMSKYSEVKRREGPVPGFRYRKGDQTTGLEFYTLVTNGNMMMFHRADFQRVLLGRLPKSYKIHTSKRLRSYTQCASGPIEVFFEDGSTTTCDVLIGADGIKSAARRSLLTEKAEQARSEGKHDEADTLMARIEPTWSGLTCYRALISTDELKQSAPHHKIYTRPTQYLGKDTSIIAYPIGGGKLINFVAFTARHDLEHSPFDGPWVSPVDRSEFAPFFDKWETEAHQLIACVHKTLRWAVHQVQPLDTYVSGGVALVGDANRNIDVVFLSPPWGGPSYLDAPLTVSETATPSSGEDTQEPSVGEHPDYSLASIQPIHGSALFSLSRQITPNIAYYLPRNTRLDEISDLLKVGPQYGDGDADPDSQEHVEVEEEWMGRKLKALTCYFGGLVDGQEALF
ncbi:hypothetical protein H0H93_013852, partial [Arthromyces matolae]